MTKKIAYKLELLYNKHIPMIIALCLATNNILCYFNIYKFYEIGGYIFGMSLFPIIHMYISSIAYKFCKYHRMFIHYIVTNYSINLYDYYIGIPISSHNLFYINIIIMAIFLFLILYYYLQSKHKNNDISYKETLIESC
jgi:hypothetical protein